MAGEMINYTIVATAEERSAVCARIAAAARRFAPNPRWEIDTLLVLVAVAGEHLRKEAVRRLVYLITAATGHHAALAHKVTQMLIENKDAPDCQTPMLYIAAWVIGEYGRFLVVEPPPLTEAAATSVIPAGPRGRVRTPREVVDLLVSLLIHHKATSETRGVTLVALAKLTARYRDAATTTVAREAIASYRTSVDTDLQQRSVELLSMTAESLLELRDELLAPVPALEGDAVRSITARAAAAEDDELLESGGRRVGGDGDDDDFDAADEDGADMLGKPSTAASAATPASARKGRALQSMEAEHATAEEAAARRAAERLAGGDDDAGLGDLFGPGVGSAAAPGAGPAAADDEDDVLGALSGLTLSTGITAGAAAVHSGAGTTGLASVGARGAAALNLDALFRATPVMPAASVAPVAPSPMMMMMMGMPAPMSMGMPPVPVPVPAPAPAPAVGLSSITSTPAVARAVAPAPVVPAGTEAMRHGPLVVLLSTSKPEGAASQRADVHVTIRNTSATDTIRSIVLETAVAKYMTQVVGPQSAADARPGEAVTRVITLSNPNRGAKPFRLMARLQYILPSGETPSAQADVSSALPTDL